MSELKNKNGKPAEAEESSPEAIEIESVESADVEAEAPAVQGEVEELSLEAQLEAARAEASKNLDGWMRAQAEFSNARKRMEKQRAESYFNATANVVTKLLPALDDLDRAMSDVPQAIAEHSWLEGMTLLQRKLQSILDGWNVKPIQAVGQPFDPNLHEAIMQEPSDEYESGVVTRELQQGYQLGDRVIRASLVYVAE